MKDTVWGRGVPYKVSALEENFETFFPSKIIEKKHQEVYPKLKEKVGKKYDVLKVGRKLEKNIP